MSKACLSFTAAFAVVLVASVAQAGQSWQDAEVMPSSAEVSLQADDGSTTSLYDISWPATVTKTKGRFLWVQDDGGYSRTQSGGWVYCDDVVRLDGASEHFSSELRKRETAWLYWMRGICWESKGEPGIAIADYQSALRVEPNTTLDDVHIRLGRLFAQEQMLNGRGKYDPAVRKVWEGHFQACASPQSQSSAVVLRMGLRSEPGLRLHAGPAGRRAKKVDAENFIAENFIAERQVGAKRQRLGKRHKTTCFRPRENARIIGP